MCYRATCSRRPACPPTGTRSASCGRLGRLHRDRQEVPGRQPGKSDPSSSTARTRTTTRSCRRRRAQGRQRDLLRQEQRARHASRTRPSSGLDDTVKMSARPAADRLASPSPRRGTPAFKKGAFATMRLPGLDARLSSRSGRRRNKGKWDVADGARRRRQLGRFLARGAHAEQAPQGGGRAGRFLTSPSGRSRRSRRSATCPPVAGAAGPGGQGVHQPVLQQRAGRPDLRHRRQAAAAGLPRRRATGGPDRRWRHAPAPDGRRAAIPHDRPGHKRSRTPDRSGSGLTRCAGRIRPRR